MAGISGTKKAAFLQLSYQDGGEGGIRTLDTLPYTHFPGVLLQPLGHLTVFELLFRREFVTFLQCCGLWLRRTPCVLSFIASFAGLGQPLRHLTVFDSLLKAWNLTF